MANSHDLPIDFDEAEARLKAFLLEQSFPANVCWIELEDLAVDGPEHRFVYLRRQGKRVVCESRYLSGITKGLGIHLVAHCAESERTFCSVYVPQDEVDAQRRMIGPGLKLSCPNILVRAIEVRNPVRWFLLNRINRERNRMVRDF